MTAPIGPLVVALPTQSIAPVTTMDGAGASGSDFAGKLADTIQNLQDLETKSDNLAVKSATGTLTDAHDYMIASTETALATELTVAVRNKAVEAFNEIMRMQA